MIPYYIPTPNFDLLMSVEDNNFFEIVGTTKASYGPNDVRTYYNSEVKVKIKKSSGTKNINDFSKVVVSIRRKPLAIGQTRVSLPENALQDFSASSQTSSEVPQQINTAYLNSTFGLSFPPLPSSLEKKLYSGMQIVQDAGKREEIVATKDITISLSTEELNQFYNVPSLVETASSPQRSSSPPYVEIDPSNLLQKINRELTDITEPVTEENLSSLSSPTVPSVIEAYTTNTLKKRSRSLYGGIVKYYLDDVARRPDEDSIKNYSTSSVIRQLTDFEFTTTLKINKTLKSEALEVVYQLYRIQSNVPEETIVKPLDLKRHTEAFESIQNPPIVSYTSVLSGFIRSGFITIVDKEQRGKVASFKVYSKDITPSGETTSYVLIDEIANNDQILSAGISPNSNLSVIRVVPVASNGEESNVFTNIMIGPGHSSTGNLSIVCKPIPSDAPRVEVTVYNIPKEAQRLTLFRRVVSEGSLGNDFSADASLDLGADNNNTGNFTSKITDPNPAQYTEYFVQVDLPYSEKLNSEVVLTQNTRVSQQTSGVDVRLTELKKISEGNDYKVSFKLETVVLPNENARVVELLRSRPELKEIYDSLQSPANQSSSGAATPSYEKPIYANLYVHEVVRTDLNTGERSVFDIISDGTFIDDRNTRSKKNINDINPQHAYAYQVFTYEKDPITLLRRYVLSVKDSESKTYYYVPYKWNNPSINGYRTMPATDSEDLPILSEYSNFTAKPLGEKNLVTIQGSGEFASVTRVIATRIDRNTNRIDWDFDISNYSSVYDSFVVMKVVNGYRSFVGRTKNNYIYHELSSRDLGSIYYTVVPITSEFDIDTPAHSEPIVLRPDGILMPQVTQGVIEIPVVFSDPLLPRPDGVFLGNR